MIEDQKSTLAGAVRDYWEVQPPYKESDGVKRGSLEWYRATTRNRFQLIPYLSQWVGAETFKGKKVLEIGCGAGADLCEFARAGADVTGIDITETAVNLTAERLRVEGLPGNVKTYNGRELPFDSETFDLVYSHGVLHHTPFMDDLLSEAHRVLKISGQLKMMVYHKKSLLYYYSILYLRRFKENQNQMTRDEVLSRFSEFRENCPLTRCYYPGELKEKLWFFKSVDTFVKYCVYDTPEQRKLKGNRILGVEKTGIADIDKFFGAYNADVSAKNELSKYGWHLLAHAFK